MRSISVFLTTIRMPFSWKERLFVAIAWVPKGSLQVKKGFTGKHFFYSSIFPSVCRKSVKLTIR